MKKKKTFPTQVVNGKKVKRKRGKVTFFFKTVFVKSFFFFFMFFFKLYLLSNLFSI